MAYTNTGGSLDEGGYQLGVFLVKAHYTVRGRRAIPLSATVKLLQMSEKERQLFEAAIQECRNVLSSSKKLIR